MVWILDKKYRKVKIDQIEHENEIEDIRNSLKICSWSIKDKSISYIKLINRINLLYIYSVSKNKMKCCIELKKLLLVSDTHCIPTLKPIVDLYVSLMKQWRPLCLTRTPSGTDIPNIGDRSDCSKEPSETNVCLIRNLTSFL